MDLKKNIHFAFSICLTHEMVILQAIFQIAFTMIFSGGIPGRKKPWQIKKLLSLTLIKN
jgi:hypothetical protein